MVSYIGVNPLLSTVSGHPRFSVVRCRRICGHPHNFDHLGISYINLLYFGPHLFREGRSKGAEEERRIGLWDISVFIIGPFKQWSSLTCKRILHITKSAKDYVHMYKNLQSVSYTHLTLPTIYSV